MKEILDLNDAQEERFFAAYTITKRAMEQFKIFPRDESAYPDDKRRAAQWDELDTGYPLMKLAHLYDVVQQTASVVAKDRGEPFLETPQFAENRGRLTEMIAQTDPKSIASWRALQGKLGKIRRLKVFDAPKGKAEALNFAEMLQPGRVSIVDLSDSDSPYINNLIIAELLRGVQGAQEKSYRRAVEAGEPPTPTLIFIEEAHEFLSASASRRWKRSSSR